MSWIGLADSEGVEFDLAGLHRAQAQRTPPPTAMGGGDGAQAHRGTILLEADVAQFTVPRPLLESILGASFALEVAFGTDDMLDFGLRIGDGVWDHRLPLTITNELQVVRISYAWDTDTGAGILSVYQPRSRHLAQCIVPNPRAVPWAALRALAHDAPDMCRANDIRFVAISRGFEPAGAMPDLCGSTPVMTPDGPRALRSIEAGDTVLSIKGRPLTVLRNVRRLLPARGSFVPHTLLAPHFGLTHDLHLSGEAQLELVGPDVEYLFGQEAVLGQVDKLGDRCAKPLPGPRTVALYHQLVFEDVACFDAGIGVASLDLGAAEPVGIAKATTIWADLPDDTSAIQHDDIPHTQAMGYELRSLNTSRAA